MILGTTGRKAGHLRVGPYYPEEVVYMEDSIVKAVRVLQPGHYLWDWTGKELLIREVPEYAPR